MRTSWIPLLGVGLFNGLIAVALLVLVNICIQANYWWAVDSEAQVQPEHVQIGRALGLSLPGLLAGAAGTWLVHRWWTRTGGQVRSTDGARLNFRVGVRIAACSGAFMGMLFACIGIFGFASTNFQHLARFDPHVWSAVPVVVLGVAFLPAFSALAALILGVLSGAVFPAGWLFVRFEQKHPQLLAQGGADPGA